MRMHRGRQLVSLKSLMAGDRKVQVSVASVRRPWRKPMLVGFVALAAAAVLAGSDVGGAGERSWVGDLLVWATWLASLGLTGYASVQWSMERELRRAQKAGVVIERPPAPLLPECPLLPVGPEADVVAPSQPGAPGPGLAVDGDGPDGRAERLAASLEGRDAFVDVVIGGRSGR
jgi:hypothetical protein